MVARVLLVVVVASIAGTAMAGAPLPPPSSSAAPSTSAKAAAREAFAEGIKRYDVGDYAGARDKFSEAWALVPLSTVRWNVARCEEKLGRTATAWALYRATAVDAAAEGKPKIEAQAADAATALEPEVPRLTVVVTPSDALVTVDGETVPAGVATKLDPGARVVVVRKGDKAKKLTVTLVDGDKKSVALAL